MINKLSQFNTGWGRAVILEFETLVKGLGGVLIRPKMPLN